MKETNIMAESRAEQSRAEQSRAEQSRAEQNRCIVIGRMDNTVDHTFESANRIYSANALAPTIPTNCGGDHLPKIIVKDMRNDNG